MGFLGGIFGRKKQQGPKADAIFSLVTAQVTMATRHEMTSTGKVASASAP